MKQLISNSTQQTQKIAETFSKQLRTGIIALTGDLGSGKTTFVQAFAKSLEIKEKIISPTFIIVRQHKIPKSKRLLIHIDLYRIENKTQIRQLGLEDFFNDPHNLVFVEWADRAKGILPKNTVRINFETLGENKRKIEVS